MKTKFCLVGIFAFVTLVAAAPRTWVLKTGETVTGDYFSSGTTTLVVKTGGTNCFIKISDLSTNDQADVVEMQVAQRQARLNAETNQLVANGYFEATVSLMKNFPEKFKEISNNWMDVEFDELNNDNLLELQRACDAENKYLSSIAGNSPEEFQFDWRENGLGFYVKDKNGNYYGYCWVSKHMPVINDLVKLKKGDKVRLIGNVDAMGKSFGSFGGSDQYQLWFQVLKIEIIEYAAEKKFMEQQDTSTQ